jgi:hypothetical protein
MENPSAGRVLVTNCKPQMVVSGEDYPSTGASPNQPSSPTLILRFAVLTSLRFTMALSLFLTLSEILQASRGEQAKPER